MRPYGIATKKDHTASHVDFNTRIRNWTCEWLVRPGIAFSELHETIEQNWKRIKELPPLLNQNFFSDASKKIDDMSKVTLALRQTEESSDINDCNMVDIMSNLSKRFSEEDDFMETYMDEAFHVGASMFLLGVHLKPANWIFTDLPQTAKMANTDKFLNDFKQEKTSTSYMLSTVQDLCKRDDGRERGPQRKSLQQILQENKDQLEQCSSQQLDFSEMSSASSQSRAAKRAHDQDHASPMKQKKRRKDQDPQSPVKQKHIFFSNDESDDDLAMKTSKKGKNKKNQQKPKKKKQQPKE